MEIKSSSFKHGVTTEDIEHAFTNALRYVSYEYNGEERLLIIGPAQNGKLLELVAVPAEDPNRIIHADNLRKKFYNFAYCR